jgi:hypothetical protein
VYFIFGKWNWGPGDFEFGATCVCENGSKFYVGFRTGIGGEGLRSYFTARGL